jgi:hypothetical protein
VDSSERNGIGQASLFLWYVLATLLIMFGSIGWIVLEQRLKLAHTWPYNTEMLRTLTITILTPLFVALLCVASALLLEQW